MSPIQFKIDLTEEEIRTEIERFEGLAEDAELNYRSGWILWDKHRNLVMCEGKKAHWDSPYHGNKPIVYSNEESSEIQESYARRRRPIVRCNRLAYFETHLWMLAKRLEELNQFMEESVICESNS